MKSHPVTRVGLAMIGAVLLAPAAPAQDAIEEIIVTARQREETLRYATCPARCGSSPPKTSSAPESSAPRTSCT